MPRNARLQSVPAVNAPVQGTAADVIKIAMHRIDAAIRDRGWRSRLVLQVHDELVFDCAPEDADRLPALVEEMMTSVVDLTVPLAVEWGLGPDWLAAH